MRKTGKGHHPQRLHAPRAAMLVMLIAAVCTGWSDVVHAQTETAEILDDPSELSESSLAPADLSTDLRKLSQLSFEELLAIQVTSVQGTAQEWFHTPSAIYVITPEQVRRSGYRTLAETLRLAPGMFVGRVDSSKWRIGPRGFTGAAITATKNLVLIDGRTVYDPVFSGTFWETQDVLTEDIDRIEVIRGPGATLWGANAVNGVINVLTRSAKDTQGLYLNTSYGSPHTNSSAVRFGGEIDDNTWFRVWGKYDSWTDFENAAGISNQDDWSIGRMGFRIDGERDDGISWMLKGEGYHSFTFGEQNRVPIPMMNVQFSNVVGDRDLNGASIQFRLNKAEDDGSGWSFQTYYDRIEREDFMGLRVDRDTFDTEFRRYFQWGGNHEMIWGGRFNFTSDRTDDSPRIRFDPSAETHYTVSGFVQNTTELVEDRLHAMIGTKIEYNNYTGVEVQPSARLWWTPSEDQIVWAAVSRAVRVPSRLERTGTLVNAIVDGALIGGTPGVFQEVGVGGGGDLDAEVLLAYELGHRIHITPDVTFDTALFYHDYDRLIFPGSIITPWTNNGEGQSYGVETSLTYRVAPNWRVEASWSWLRVNQQGPVLQFEEENTPRNLAYLRSYLDISKNVELNASIYYMDEVPQQSLPSNLRLDVGVTWRVSEQLELTAWGQNLLDPGHGEASAVEIPRGYYIQGTLRF